MYEVRLVANAMIKLHRQKGLELSLTRLELLLYFAQGIHLVATDKSLFGEYIECSKFCPNIREIKEAWYASNQPQWNIRREFFVPLFKHPRHLPRSAANAWAVIEAVIETWKNYSDEQIFSVSRDESLPEGYPWAYAKKHGIPYLSRDIIKESFSKLFNGNPPQGE